VDSAFQPAEPTAPAASPLVSVLVRSIDRSLLDEALASVARQTWPNVEVVVVAAKPGHRALPERCGPFAMRLVPTDLPLHRSEAANRGLDHARGDYLLFLDDDDWLMPGHLARLAEILQRQPRARVAYTGVALTNDKGEPLGQAMDLPFDGIRQLAGNITPIHAVMFERGLCDAGARFDEQLDHYEDWDFWLQLARRCAFVHLPGVSAFYRIHESSGVHVDPGAGNAAAAKIFDKWQGRWNAAQRARLMERAWATDDLQRALDAANTAIDDLRRVAAEQHAILGRQSASIAQQENLMVQQRAEMQELLREQAHELSRLITQSDRLTTQTEQQRAEIARRDHQIADLMNSTSWKVTAPLRRLSGAFRRR
jgi:hypothetical protein